MTGDLAPRRRQATWWLPSPWALTVIAGVAAALLRFSTVPPVSTILSLAVGVGAAGLLVFAGLRRHRGQAPAFVMLAAAILLGSISMVLRTMADVPVASAAGALSDVGTNVFGAAGVLLFARGFRRADPDAWLDASSVGVLLSVLIYDVVIERFGPSGPQPLGGIVVMFLDAALFAILLRFVFRFVRNPSLVVLAMVLGCAITLDAAYSGSGGAATGVPLSLYEGVWLLGYLVAGAATLHPGLRLRSDVLPDEEAGLEHAVRRVLLAVAIHTGSGVIVLAVMGTHLLSGDTKSLPVPTVGLVALLALGTIRSVRVVQRLERDIEARTIAEKALRASEQRYHRLAEVAPVGIIETTSDGRPFAANAAWLAMTGHAASGEPVPGLLESVHPDDMARVASAWNDAEAGGRPIDEDHRLVRPDGTIRWARTTATPLKDDSARVTGWVVAVSDVTDLVEARTAALEREAFATGLQEQSPIGIEVYGVDGQTLRRNDAQRRVRDVAGVGDGPVADVRTDPLMVALAQGPAIERALAGFTESVEPETVRLAGASGGGQPSEAWLRIRWFPLKGDDGRVIAIISFTEDVSARVQAAADRQAAEVAVREAAKLEALGVLAGGIAHDFNNILVAILGHIGFAREGIADGSPAAADLTSAEQAAHRAADLARQMLAYSGHGTIQVGPMSLNTAARDMGEMVTSGLNPGARVVFDLDTSLPSVIADATQVRQIVLNLVVNASEALGGRAGTITVRTRLVTVTTDDPHLVPAMLVEPGTYVALEVADTGVGMDAATARRIFEPFFSTKKAGRGLGLAATLGIVKGHDGAIRVRSTPGEGTSFEILLRPDGGVVPPPVPVANAPEVKRGAVVLLVDDEDTVRLIARRILERAGFTVVEAIDGPEAIERFAAAPHTYAAAVLDLALPSLGGRAVLAEMRDRRADIPVVICSGWAADDVGDTLRASPHTAFLQKPFTAAALTGALVGVMQNPGGPAAEASAASA